MDKMGDSAPIEAQDQSTSPPPSPPPRASLLGIPIELRDKIYQWLFKSKNGYLQPYHHENWNMMPRWRIRRLSTSILCVNKQLYAEAKHILYTDNVFAITPSFLRLETQQAALARVKTIKLAIHFFAYRVDITNVIEFLARYTDWEPLEWTLRSFAHGSIDVRAQLGISLMNGRCILRTVYMNARGFLYLRRKEKGEELVIDPGERWVLEGLKRWVRWYSPTESQEIANLVWDEFERKRYEPEPAGSDPGDKSAEAASLLRR